MKTSLSNYEQETIISFNKDESIAHIFTYEKTWQKHLEQRLGLEPTNDNGFGGKGYEVPKGRITMPRAKKKISPELKKKLAERLLANTRKAKPDCSAFSTKGNFKCIGNH